MRLAGTPNTPSPLSPHQFRPVRAPTPPQLPPPLGTALDTGPVATTTNKVTSWPSPPESRSGSSRPLLVQALSFLQDPHTHNSSVTVIRRFHDVSEDTYHESIDAITSLVRESFGNRARIDYYGDLSRMIIRIPTEQHEILAFESSMFIRQLLYDQGFCWPNWPGGMHYIEQTGAADRKIPRAGRPGSGFQPDASLKIKGMEFPFLVVEVADSQEYAEARLKAHSFLLDTQGQVRFVIIVDLVRKTWKQKREARLAAERDVPGAGYEPSESENQDPGTGENLESLPSRSKGETSGLGEDRDSEAAAASDPADTSGSNPQHMPSNKRPGDHSSPHPTAKKLRAAPGPAASTRSPAAGLTPTTPPAASSPSDEGSPTLPPPHTHEGYTHATVTVLTSHRAPRANRRKGNSKGKREVITLIRPTEFWPTPPPADLKFSFTWDDMEIADYPPELKDSIYTIRFDWLHTALKVYFSVPGEGQVPQPLLDGSSAVGRSDEEEEEVEEEPSSGRVESDESYRP